MADKKFDNRAGSLLVLIGVIAITALCIYYAAKDDTHSNESLARNNEGRSGPGAGRKTFLPSGYQHQNNKMSNMSNMPTNPDEDPGHKIGAIFSKIIARIPRGVDWWDRNKTLQYISRSEHVIVMLSSFFGGCENHGTLYRDSWGGYQLRDYMLDAGVVECAEVFLKLYPLTLAEQELDEIHEQLSDDEADDRYESIKNEMKKIEKQMPSESYEEINVLLWAYAQKQGLDKLLSPDSNGGE